MKGSYINAPIVIPTVISANIVPFENPQNTI